MIKITRKSIIVIAILAIIILIVSRIYIDSNITNKNAMLSDYTTKKEDLIIKQQQLQSQIRDLNNTLQAEISRQNNLSNQLTGLTGQPVTNINSGGTTSPSSPSQPSAPAVQTPSTPNPPPVTRAS